MYEFPEMFGRLYWQQICDFLLFGVGRNTFDNRSYAEQLGDARKALSQNLKTLCEDMEHYDEIDRCVLNYGAAMQSVYMEIGLQCGFMLAMQMQSNLQ